ncbi:MAG: methyltransferase domain-containing protein [Terriglobales bacterium]|jgi:2-polyprenyl-3-methyl-5-hydroxy-6-metoxy-1,4-benzoquinol methylase
MKTLLRPCPVCGGGRGDVLHHQRFAVSDDYPLPDEYDVVICAACGMVYADTPATQADYDKFYATCSIYEQPAGAQVGKTPPEDIARLEQTGAIFANHIPSKEACILDVGCANGGLLQVLGRLGFRNLVGVDPSPACVENTRNGGCQSYQGDLAHLPGEIGCFDAVILTSVLEHVLDVKRAISALVSVCSANGRIFLEVPDAARYADYLHSPFQDINTEHINHFNVTSLRNLMTQFGFAPVLEKRVLVTGFSGLLFPGLEAGYERRSGPVQQPWPIDSAFRGQMERYINVSRVMMQEIDQHLRSVLASSMEVIVWGTGQLTMKLLCDTALRDAKVLAFVDGNPVNVGKTLRGVPIIRPDQLENQRAPIILATLLHTQAIRNRIASLGLTNPVVKLQAH